MMQKDPVIFCAVVCVLCFIGIALCIVRFEDPSKNGPQHDGMDSASDSVVDDDFSKLPLMVDPYSLELDTRQAIVKKYLASTKTNMDGWVDPHDMLKPYNEIAETNLESEVDDKMSSHLHAMQEVVHDINSKKNSRRMFKLALETVLVTRWLKKLTLKVKQFAEEETTSVSFSLDPTSVQRLEELSKNVDIEALDEIVSDLLTNAHIAIKKPYDWSAWTPWILNLFFILGPVLLIVFYKRCFDIYPKVTTAVTLVIFSVFWHWMHLYQKRIAHKHAEMSSVQMPAQCRKHDFGFFEHFVESFKGLFSGSDDCSKYYEAVMVDPFWEVSWTVAFSEAVASMFFQPLHAASRVINVAMKQLFEGMPLFVMIIMVPLLFLILIMTFRYRIRLPFFSIEPHTPSSAAISSRIEDIPSPLKALQIEAHHVIVPNVGDSTSNLTNEHLVKTEVIDADNSIVSITADAVTKKSETAQDEKSIVIATTDFILDGVTKITESAEDKKSNDISIADSRLENVSLSNMAFVSHSEESSSEQVIGESFQLSAENLEKFTCELEKESGMHMSNTSNILEEDDDSDNSFDVISCDKSDNKSEDI